MRASLPLPQKLLAGSVGQGVADALLEQAKRIVVRDGITLRELVEEGLRLAIAKRSQRTAFVLADASVDGCGLQPGALDVLRTMGLAPPRRRSRSRR